MSPSTDMTIEVHTKMRRLWRLTLLRWLCRLRSGWLIEALVRTGRFDPRIGFKIGHDKREWQRIRMEID